MLESTETLFPDPPVSHAFDPSFGSLVLPKQKAILDLPDEELVPQWNTCIASAIPIKILLDEALDEAKRLAVCIPFLFYPLCLIYYLWAFYRMKASSERTITSLLSENISRA